MTRGIQPQVELLTDGYRGINNVLQFSQLPRSQSPQMQNAYMSKLNAIGKRPGSKPITQTALTSDIEYLTTYKSSASATDRPKIYAASDDTLYLFDGVDTLDALTMTDNLNQADIYTIGFTNEALTSRLLIADGADLKGCDGTAVADITPASDDSSPAPANVLDDINTKGIKYVWGYRGYVFVSPGTNELFFSKLREYDYYPETSWFFLVKDNDFINGCGLAFDNVCLVPMRRSWAILTGTSFDDFEADEFLNTEDGVIAPRSIQKVNYPDGTQTVIYLSDNSVHEIFTAVYTDTSRQYATRDLMKERIDFEGIGLSEAEKEAAVGFFDNSRSLYLLSFQKDSVNYTYAYDLRNREWYIDWLTFNAKSYVSLDSVTYFAGSLKHLCKFDKDLYTDWNESTKDTGTAVYFKRYSPLLSLENTGYASYFDYYIVEMKQWPLPSSLDVTVIFTQSSSLAPTSIDSSSAVWDIGSWDESFWTNEDYTETVNEPRRIVYKKKAKYVQVLWENNADQPMEIYWDRWLGRNSGQ